MTKEMVQKLKEDIGKRDSHAPKNTTGRVMEAQKQVELFLKSPNHQIVG